MTDIRDIINHLRDAEPIFEPFALKIDEMSKAFQFREIIEFIRSAQSPPKTMGR